MNNWQSQQQLKQQLSRIDGRGYKAYKDIAGKYRFDDFDLFIDYVQGDPFASPSRLRVRVSQQIAGYPTTLFNHNSRRIGLEAYIAAAFAQACQTAAGRNGSGKSGLIAIDRPGQELIERTAVHINTDFVEARFVVGLPARGRSVMGRAAAKMLCEDLPKLVNAALIYANGRPEVMRRFAETNEDADTLRQALQEQNLVAFVADDSILPRRSGIDNRPLKGDNVVQFSSPESLRVSFELPNRGRVSGMGIPAGVTLIVGGGFHGKSTLLNALERGIYNHRPGDGRDLVVSDPTAVKIRAEDGRSVVGVNISPFINNLPHGRNTQNFSSENASGSTSQAANIVEALELGSQLILIDEDTAATNFMIRDQRMQALIAKDKEPITPFIDKVRQLYDEHGVSTILVIGGSGDYFEVADHVIALDSYHVHDVTSEAKEIAAQHGRPRTSEGGQSFGQITARIPTPKSLDPRKGRRDTNVKSRGVDGLQFGEEHIDLWSVSQLVDESQTRAIGAALVYALDNHFDGRRSLAEALDLTMQDIANKGLDVLDRRYVGDLAAFRPFELGAAVNRYRPLRLK